MSQSDVMVALSTVDSSEKAALIARRLVEEKVAACVNILPGATSVYFWKNKLCEELECLLLIKTTAEKIELLKTKIRELHPYEIPELIILPVTDGLPDYLAWVGGD